MGNISGAYMTLNPKKVWRVNPDGEVRDTFKRLTGVFEMNEVDFFQKYCSLSGNKKTECAYYRECVAEVNKIRAKIPELPFSNPWIAQQTASHIPDNSILYLGILNTLRLWNYFDTPETITCYSNTGGFGIDGGVSAIVGLSLADKNKLCFGVVGDLGFFYDMNALGNRHVGNNLRLMLINNGRGTEFRNFYHLASHFGDDADFYMAAAGHYGAQSRTLVKHFAHDLGYEYLSATNKEEYLSCLKCFLTPKVTDRPMLFEVFTDSQCESDALEMLSNLEVSATGATKKFLKKALGDRGVQMAKNILNK